MHDTPSYKKKEGRNQCLQPSVKKANIGEMELPARMDSIRGAKKTASLRLKPSPS